MPEDRRQLWWEPEVVRAPALAPATEGASHPPAAGRGRRRRWLLVVGLALVLAALGLGLGLAFSDGGAPPGRAGPAPGPSAAGGPPGRARAAAANLVLGDLPPRWSVDRSAGNPLAGFLAVSPSAGPPGPGSGRSSVVARQFESCLGVDAAGDALFGPGGPRPLVEVSSPSFRSPTGGDALEAGSQTALYRTSSPVPEVAAEMAAPRFGPCFSTALSQELMAGTSRAARQALGAGSTGRSGRAPSVAFEAPTSSVLSVPALPGTVAAGVAVNMPFVVDGIPHQLTIGMVLVGGGQLQTTIVTLSGPGGTPVGLLDSLAVAVGRRLAPATGGGAVLSLAGRG